MRAAGRRLALVALLALVPACGDDEPRAPSGPPAGYPFAYATTSCAPNDGPATRVMLTPTAVDSVPVDEPQLVVTIYRGAASLQGESVSFREGSALGWAGRCPTNTTCEPASATTISFARNAADTLLSGTLALRFDDGTLLSGTFDAQWRRTGLLCG